MSDSLSAEGPAGFELFETTSPFNLHLGPYYARVVDRVVTLGLRVAAHHCNRSGRLHGGMISTLADIAIGNNIGLALSFDEDFRDKKADDRPSIATVSMSTDFTGTAKEGEWVEVNVDLQNVGKTLAFGNAYLLCNDLRIARVSAVFRIFRPASS